IDSETTWVAQPTALGLAVRSPDPSTSGCESDRPLNAQPCHVKIVDAGGVEARDLGLFVLWHALQDLGEDLARSRKRRLAVRVVRAPHHVARTNYVAQADADRVLLKA